MEMRRHLSLFSVRLGHPKSAKFANEKVASKPHFPQRCHVFPNTALQFIANNARRAHIIPRYNALLNYHPGDISKLAAEAAEINISYSSFPHPQILYSPISPTMSTDSSLIELPNSSVNDMQYLQEHHSLEIGVDVPSPIPTVDVTSTVCIPAWTWKDLSPKLSEFQDMELKLSHTLNFQCAMLQKQHPTHIYQTLNSKCYNTCCVRIFYPLLLFLCILPLPLKLHRESLILIWENHFHK